VNKYGSGSRRIRGLAVGRPVFRTTDPYNKNIERLVREASLPLYVNDVAYQRKETNTCGRYASLNKLGLDPEEMEELTTEPLET
jgi:hypothetical protein